MGRSKIAPKGGQRWNLVTFSICADFQSCISNLTREIEYKKFLELDSSTECDWNDRMSHRLCRIPTVHSSFFWGDKGRGKIVSHEFVVIHCN